jgi:indole-3-glycerol phosphate synthase
VQASSAWTAPSGTLGRLVAEARVRARALHASSSDLKRRVSSTSRTPSLKDALTLPKVAILAELKRRSPSKGWIQKGLSAPEQARAYASGGASALSVLTEPDHFGGSVDDLQAVREAVTLPILKKDFHVDPLQLLEAKVVGASAALLIARALSPDELRSMMHSAHELELEVLVEVRDETELELALSLDATLIGVNNRNLETLEMDASTSERLLPLIPSSVVAIAESGISSREDVERVGRVGADAVLVGSSISASERPLEAVRALTNVDKARRAR